MSANNSNPPQSQQPPKRLRRPPAAPLPNTPLSQRPAQNPADSPHHAQASGRPSASTPANTAPPQRRAAQPLTPQGTGSSIAGSPKLPKTTSNARPQQRNHSEGEPQPTVGNSPTLKPPAPSQGNRPRPIPSIYAAPRPSTPQAPAKTPAHPAQPIHPVDPTPPTKPSRWRFGRSRPHGGEIAGESAKMRADKSPSPLGKAVNRSVKLRGQAVPLSEPAQSGRVPNRTPSGPPPSGRAVVVEERPVDVLPTEPSRRRSPLSWFRWVASWQFLLLTTIALVSGAGAFSVISLFRIPNLPNCRAIFWPTASAALRLQCADSYAEQGTVDFYLEAIALVDRLPADHPLRGDINARIEEWAGAILDLADGSFQSGELDVAIATARKIPPSTAAADLVEGRIRQWQRVWNNASEIYEAAKQNLSELKFQEAFSLAVQLLDIPNDYWSNTQYNELTRLVGLAREDSGKITKAKQLAQRRTVAAFQEAMTLLTSIGEDSVIYGTAQAVQKEMAGDMLEVAERALRRQRLSEAEGILAIIPRNAGLNQEIADFQVFVEAYQRAWSGDALGLDSAITRLQSISQDRPLYGRAQALIGRWRAEMTALAQLDQARQTAAGGTVADLQAAIAQAEQISRNNPRWDETSRQIGRWRERVQTVEDQPILNRADQLANPGTPEALQAAIAEAGKIRSDRALHPQASSRISSWRRRLQQIEDQPTLERARQQARSGDLNGAIATASQIGAGRALYSEAQNDVNTWQQQNQSNTWLAQAEQSAATGTASGLGNAIALARQIPQSSSRYTEAAARINRWSWSLLSQAEGIALTDPSRAIALAQQIPAQSEAYGSAQVRIREWRAAQAPPAQIDLAPASPETVIESAPAPLSDTSETLD